MSRSFMSSFLDSNENIPNTRIAKYKKNVRHPHPEYFLEYLDRLSSSEIFSNPSILYFRIFLFRIISQTMMIPSTKNTRRDSNLIIMAMLWIATSSPSN